MNRLFASSLLAVTLLASLPAGAAEVTLHETGSTLLYPLFQLWSVDYAAANPGTGIATAATGSGAGIAEAVAGHVQIGASDAYMSDEEAERDRHILNIPVAISAQTVNYNLPGLGGTKLKLDGPALAGSYSGTIRMWDSPEIAGMNPGLHLPHQAIIPIRRADPSGDTFIFTQFLDFAVPSWDEAVGFGTKVPWPAVSGARSANGNEGMVKALAATPYSVGYVGVSFEDTVARAGLGTAMLRSQAGQFLLPTAETVNAAASELDSRTPADERLSLVFAPGDNAYPLINYEYVVVSTRQPDPATAAAIRNFLLWSISPEGGNAPQYLTAVHFIALPDFIRALSENQIKRIQ